MIQGLKLCDWAYGSHIKTFVYFKLMGMGMLPMCMSLYYVPLEGVDLLGLGLETVISCHVDSEKWILFI